MWLDCPAACVASSTGAGGQANCLLVLQGAGSGGRDCPLLQGVRLVPATPLIYKVHCSFYVFKLFLLFIVTMVYFSIDGLDHSS